MALGRTLILSAAAIGILAAVAHVGIPRFAEHTSAALVQNDPSPIACDLDGQTAAVKRFAGLLRFASVSSMDAHDTHVDAERLPIFLEMLEYLRTQYKDAYRAMELEMVGAGNLTTLLTWSGSDPVLLPLLFISHYDVVPVTSGTESEWLHGPFSGARVDGHIWARGALDVKFSVAALLEAAGQLIRRGFAPQRTIYFAFGHDEEVGGNLGASQVAALLASRGVTFEVVIDEGGVIFSDGVKQFTSTPVAMVGTSEKIYTTVEVNLTSRGGHSSMPPIDGSDIAAQAAKLITYVRKHPFPASLREPTLGFLKSLVPYTSSPLQRLLMLYAHVWPLNKIIATAFVSVSPETAALVRTTTAVTHMSAGVADNVLPQSGCIRFNCRSHPADSRDGVLDYFRAALSSSGVAGSVRIHEATHDGPTPGVADYTGPHFAALKRAIQETWRSVGGKAVAVVPFLMTGGTDSKHYAGMTRHSILRFCPYTLNKTAGDLGRIHGTNERVLEEDFRRAICTYWRAMTLLAGPVV